jgi:hypothetical protein
MSRAETRIHRHDRHKANHYFSPRNFVSKLTPERFWNPNQTFAADGGTRPKLRGRSVSTALPCIFFRIRTKDAAGTFQRGMLPDTTRIRKLVSLKLSCESPHIRAAKTHSTQQAWMNSRNQTNITSACKHRQHSILHPKGLAMRNRIGSVPATDRRKPEAAKKTGDPSQTTLRISAAGSRFAHARKAPQLADSAFSLYTTCFHNK